MAFGGLPPIPMSELTVQNAEDDLKELFLHTTEAGVKGATMGTDEVIGVFGLMVAKRYGGTLFKTYIDNIELITRGQ